MHSTIQERPDFSAVRVGTGSLVVGLHLAGLLALSLANPGGFELPLSKPSAQAIDVVILPRNQPAPPPPPMPSAPARPQAKPTPAPPISRAIPSEQPVFVESVIEAPPTTTGSTTGEVADDIAPAASGGGFAGLSILHGPQPPYPARAKRMGWQGEVVLRLRIDAEGWPREANILRSSGHADLDTSARRHVLRHWRFSPPGVEANGDLPIRFTLL